MLNAGGEADFLTYMNIFSAEKWRKYTGIQSVCVSVNFKGKIKVVIYALSCKNKKVCSKIIMQFPMESKGEDSIQFFVISCFSPLTDSYAYIQLLLLLPDHSFEHFLCQSK